MSWRDIWRKFNNLRKKEQQNSEKKSEPQLSRSLTRNKQFLQELYKDCGDISFHQFKTGSGKDGLLLYQQGLVDKTILNRFILQALMEEDQNTPKDAASLG